MAENRAGEAAVNGPVEAAGGVEAQHRPERHHLAHRFVRGGKGGVLHRPTGGAGDDDAMQLDRFLRKAPVVVGATKRLSAVRWGVTVNLIWAWILTIPVSALLASGTYCLIKFFM